MTVHQGQGTKKLTVSALLKCEVYQLWSSLYGDLAHFFGPLISVPLGIFSYVGRNSPISCMEDLVLRSLHQHVNNYLISLFSAAIPTIMYNLCPPAERLSV